MNNFGSAILFSWAARVVGAGLGGEGLRKVSPVTAANNANFVPRAQEKFGPV
jgi:hypothetical protein